jgi:hypothetical protein
MFCESSIPYGFECGNCQKAHEKAQDLVVVWSVVENGAVAFSGKTTRHEALGRLFEYANKKGAEHFNYQDEYYYDEQGNWFALRIISEIQMIPPEPIRVQPIFSE